MENIENHLPGIAQPLYEFKFLSRFVGLRWTLKLLVMRCSGFEHVLFQSFEDISTLAFLIVHPRLRIHIVVCNNLMPQRLERHPVLLPIILNAIFKRASTIFVSCQFEVNTIQKRFKSVDAAKIIIKPFHQIAVARSRVDWENKSRAVLFLGPELSYKPLHPVIELIKKDKEQRFQYVLCSLRDIDPDVHALLKARNNVIIMKGYTSDDEYYRLFSESALVITTHDRFFEGRLSGIFCDAIASGTALVVRDIAPHDEFFDRFGEMGFLVDFDSPDWAARVLDADLESLYPVFQKRMAACRDSCSDDAIERVLEQALGC